MKRWVYLGYGLACYGVFFATYLYMIGFLGNFIVPKSIDSGVVGPAGAAVGINLLLMLLLGLQHSVMARPAFKRAWTKFVPRPIERSTYVLMSCVALALLMWQWRPLPAPVWSVEQPIARTLLWALFATGWLLVPAVTLMIDHFDLFGMRQVWLYFQGRPYTSPAFRITALYHFVRHPLYLGWALAFWATPQMSVGHLLFAGTLSAYMVGAAMIEERDLLMHFGQQYADYRRSVPMFVPRFRPKGEARGADVDSPGGVGAR